MRTQKQAIAAIITFKFAFKKRCPICGQKRRWMVLDTGKEGAFRFIVQAHCDCGYMGFRETT